jgi:hypothetical protein
MRPPDEIETAVCAGAASALRERAEARRKMAREQAGSPESAICDRLARELDRLAVEIEADTPR